MRRKTHLFVLLMLTALLTCLLWTGAAWANHPLVTITSPAGGECWKPGEIHDITWTMDVDYPDGYIDIYYSDNGWGGNWTKINNNLIAPESGSNSYTWVVPNMDTNHAMIILEWKDSPITTSYETSNEFTIGEIKLLSPNGGEHWYPQEVHNITWTSTPSGSFPLGTIDLYYSTDSGANWTHIANCNNTGSYAWTVPDINTSHARIKIRKVFAFNPAQYKYDTSDADFTIGAGTMITPLPIDPIPVIPIVFIPAAPADLAAQAVSESQIDLSWTDNSSNEDGFKIERKIDGGSFSEIATVGADTASYSDSGLNADTTYYYRVRAYNSSGDSNYTSEASDTTMQPSQTAPAAPSGLDAEAVSESQIDLTWTDNSSDETGFKIERRIGGGGFSEIGAVGADTTAYSDSGLNADTTYYYRVRAYNSAGDSGYSNEDSATTETTTVIPPSPGTQTGTEIELLFHIDSSEYYVKEPGSATSQLLTMDTAPVIRESRTLLPIRYVTQHMGASVDWDPTESKATVAMDDKVIELWIGKNTARVNGQDTQIDPANSNVVPIVIPPGRTMLPLRFITENLDCQVEWDAATQGVAIRREPPDPME